MCHIPSHKTLCKFCLLLFFTDHWVSGEERPSQLNRAIYTLDQPAGVKSTSDTGDSCLRLEQPVRALWGCVLLHAYSFGAWSLCLHLSTHWWLHSDQIGHTLHPIEVQWFMLMQVLTQDTNSGAESLRVLRHFRVSKVSSWCGLWSQVDMCGISSKNGPS
jgi:hypothetical protein